MRRVGRKSRRADALLKRFDNSCAYCSRMFRDLEWRWSIDHVLPMARGGSKRGDGNLVPACVPCNSAKSGKLLWSEWRPPSPHWRTHGMVGKGRK